MPLHLVGETIDKARSYYSAETGKRVQLMRGVYVDATDDIDPTSSRSPQQPDFGRQTPMLPWMTSWNRCGLPLPRSRCQFSPAAVHRVRLP
jgi:hypothetical protein